MLSNLKSDHNHRSNRSSGTICVRSFSAVCLAVLLSGAVEGASHTWIGGALFDSWEDPFNWVGRFAPPFATTSSNPTLISMEGRGGTSRLADAVNTSLRDWHIDSLTFDPAVTGRYTILGGSLTVNSIIENHDTNNHIFSNEAVVLGDQSLSLIVSEGDLIFNTGVVYRFSQSTIAVSGNGDVFFNQDITVDGDLRDPDLSMSIDGRATVHLGDPSVIDTYTIRDGTLRLNNTNTLKTSADVELREPFAVFDLDGFNANIGQLTGTGGMVDTGGATLTFGDAADFTFSGAISGSGGLTKDQSGAAILRGANTYTGATTISAGTLRLVTGGRLSEETDVSIATPGTFDLNGVSVNVDSISGNGTILLGGAALVVDEASGIRSFTGSIQENGTLAKAGEGTLHLSGNNTFSTLHINSGTLGVINRNNLGSGSVLLEGGTLQITNSFTSDRPMLLAGGTLTINTGVTLVQTGQMSGNHLIKEGNGTLVLDANNLYLGDTRINAGIVEIDLAHAIADSSHVQLAPGTRLDLNNLSDVVASISGAGGEIETGPSGELTVDANSGTFTYGGRFTGSGTITKTGNHILDLTAASTLTGTMNIDDGRLRFSGSGSLSNETDVVLAGGRWDLNGIDDTVESISGTGFITLGGASLTVEEISTATHTFSGQISGSGTFVKNGTHTLVLSGNNSFDSELYISEGTLSVGASNNLGGPEVGIVFLGGTLQTTGSFDNSRAMLIGPFRTATFDVASTTTLAQSEAIMGDATTTLVKQGGGTLRITTPNASTFHGDIVINDGTFDMAGTGDALGNSTSVAVNGPGAFLVNNADDIGGLTGNGSVVLNAALGVGLDGGSTTFSGVISGTGSFRKSGAGTLTLSGSNTYTGVTEIAGGSLRLAGDGRLADSSNVNVGAGDTFDLNNITETIGMLNGDGSVTFGSNTQAVLTIGSNNGNGAFGGRISGSGHLVKTGNGTQTLTGSNTYSGTTSFDGGLLRTGSNANFGTGNLNFGGGTWEVTGSFTNTRQLLFGDGIVGTIDVDAGETLTQTGTVFGELSTLNKTDAGTLVLAAPASTGTVNVSGGVLRFAAGGSLHTSTRISVAEDATWDLNGINDNVATIAGAGSIELNSSAQLTVGADTGETTFSGVISGSGVLIKYGIHRLTLSGVNTYSGGTAISRGTLVVVDDANLGDAKAPVNFDGGTLEMTRSMTMDRELILRDDGGTIATIGGLNVSEVAGVISGAGALTKDGATISGLRLTGRNTYAGGTIVNTGAITVSANENLGANAGAIMLVNGSRLNVTGTFTNEHAIVLDDGGDISVGSGLTLTQAAGISGTGNLIKNGAGTLLLREPAMHAGDTVVNAGTLLVNADAERVTVTVNSGGALGGDGAVASISNHGQVSPGNSTAVLYVFDGFTQLSTGVLDIELAGVRPGTEYDQLTIQGAASLDGTLDVSLTNGFSPSDGDTFEILTADQGLSGTFQSAVLPELPGDLLWNIVYGMNSVMLAVAAPILAIPGDYNASGGVDAADYVAWRKALGQSGPGLAGDSNGDDTVDQLDYNLWRANFGATVGVEMAAASHAAVPEPRSVMSILAALIGAATYRRIGSTNSSRRSDRCTKKLFTCE